MAASPATATRPVVGVLLAGGQARRMGGGDKCLRPLGGRTILAHVIERARPQVAALVLNANGDPARFAPFGLPVVGDVVGGFAGPLAGVLTGMEWTRRTAQLPWIATIATDTRSSRAIWWSACSPRSSMTGRTSPARRRAAALIPMFGPWPVRLADDLRAAMIDEECARSTSGLHAIVSRKYRSRPIRSIRSSIPTDPRTSPRRRVCCTPARRNSVAGITQRPRISTGVAHAARGLRCVPGVLPRPGQARRPRHRGRGR